MNYASYYQHKMNQRTGASSHIHPAPWRMPKLMQQFSPRRAFVHKRNASQLGSSK